MATDAMVYERKSGALNLIKCGHLVVPILIICICIAKNLEAAGRKLILQWPFASWPLL